MNEPDRDEAALNALLNSIYLSFGPPAALARMTALSRLAVVIDSELGLVEMPKSDTLAWDAEPASSLMPVRKRIHAGLTHRRAFILAGVSVAAIAAIISALLPGSPARPLSAAAEALQRAANVAASLPARSLPKPGQYLYVDEINRSVSGQQLGPFGANENPASGYYWLATNDTTQIWVNSQGAGRLVRTIDPAVTWLTPGGAAAWAPVAAREQASCLRDGRPLINGGCPLLSSPDQASNATFNFFYGSGLPYPGNGNLPTNPTALKKAIEKSANEGHDQFSTPVQLDTSAFFNFVGHDLEAGTSPAVRSAIYQMIEHLPGVKLLGKMTDAIGRPGVGIAVAPVRSSAAQTEEQLIFNPATSALLESRTVQISNGNINPNLFPPAGSVTQYTVYVTSGVVNSKFAKPHGS